MVKDKLTIMEEENEWIQELQSEKQSHKPVDHEP